MSRCIGFGEREDTCKNEAGTGARENPLWCGECDDARIAYLDGQFKKISAGFGAGLSVSEEQPNQ